MFNNVRFLPHSGPALPGAWSEYLCGPIALPVSYCTATDQNRPVKWTTPPTLKVQSPR
ncbi:hypothetical protein M378DRAFT_169071 [Amanita muscaria Koide BX008]|uniref:Uncharacterized protein n=1 Tax=Amanita muscaria (strain Koide BX008) TaxID=946122 RepID=A0A0C2WS54_AMAMK|nr:hypothetical protein M378DRAFT_169071 [Amanita muscaria Koide BX008]